MIRLCDDCSINIHAEVCVCVCRRESFVCQIENTVVLRELYVQYYRLPAKITVMHLKRHSGVRHVYGCGVRVYSI